MDKDIVTKISKQALDIFFLNNPFNTSMGIILGFVLDGIIPVCSPIIKKFTGLDFSSVSLITWICLGVFLLNIKSLFSQDKISSSAERAFALIKEARKAGITDLEIKQKYRLLIEKYGNSVKVKKNNIDKT